MAAQLPPLSTTQNPSLASTAPHATGAVPPPSAVASIRNAAATEGNRTFTEDGRTFTEQEVRDAVEKMNEVAGAISMNIRYRIHERSERMQVQIYDVNDTDKVIRELPPTEMLNVLARTREAVGFILDINA
jgi:flagellar protein FlaG